MGNIQNLAGVHHLIVEHESDIKNYEIIDVRRPDEFSGELGHLPGARLVTLGSELDQFLARHEKSAKILFVCRSGARSTQATQTAMDLGFRDVTNMAGGMIRWNELNYTIER